MHRKFCLVLIYFSYYCHSTHLHAVVTDAAVVTHLHAVVTDAAVVTHLYAVVTDAAVVTHLYAVVTETHLYAVVTDTAVGAARRPVELARGAPLHAHRDAADLHVLVEWHPEVVVAVLVGCRCRPRTVTVGTGASGCGRIGPVTTAAYV